MKCFGAYIDDTIVGFHAVIHQPHWANTKLKRGCRIVVLPDYQGIGIGMKLNNVVAKYYSDLGFTFDTCTSAKNFIHAMNRDEKWRLISQCRHSKPGKNGIKYSSLRMNNVTCTFRYRGDR